MKLKHVPKHYKKYCLDLHKDYKYRLIPNNYVSRGVIKRYWERYIPVNEKKILIMRL